MDYGQVPHGHLAIGTQLLGQPPVRAIPEADIAWREHVPPPGRDATLLAVVPIPGTQTSLAIVGCTVSAWSPSTAPGTSSVRPPGQRRPPCDAGHLPRP